MQIKVWQTDQQVSREVAAIKIGDVRQVYFDFPPFILEGKGVDGLFDVPTLIFKRPNQFRVILNALRNAKVLRNITELWKPQSEGLTMDRPCRLTIQLRSGDEKMFWFNPRYPENVRR